MVLLPGKQVHLHVNNKTLVYATGWWNPELIPRNILEDEAPDWTSLLSRRMELHLEITQVFCGDSPSLARCSPSGAVTMLSAAEAYVGPDGFQQSAGHW